MIEAEDLAQAVHRGRILLAADRRARFHGIEIWQGTQRLYTDAVLCDAESLA
ncbi:MAG: hypothetical protein J0H67_00240 [Rhodospirillales bacterium]|nr:hypothetical protein [Rhodospirillales bacterium]